MESAVIDDRTSVSNLDDRMIRWDIEENTVVDYDTIEAPVPESQTIMTVIFTRRIEWAHEHKVSDGKRPRVRGAEIDRDCIFVAVEVEDHDRPRSVSRQGNAWRRHAQVRRHRRRNPPLSRRYIYHSAV